MKNCEECQAIIDLYLDDALTRDDKENFLAHISSCSECQKELEFAKNIKSTLSSLPVIEIPDDFTQNVRDKVEAERKKKKGFGTYFIRYGSLAACLVLALAISQGLNTSDIPSNDPVRNQVVQDSTDENQTPAPVTVQNTGDETPAPTKEKYIAKSQSTAEDESKNLSVTQPLVSEQDGISTASLDIVADSDIASPAPRSAEGGNNEENAFSENKHRDVATDEGLKLVNLTVAQESFDGAVVLATKYAECSDGIYTATRENFDAMLNEFAESGLSVTKADEAIDDIVSFVLKAE